MDTMIRISSAEKEGISVAVARAVAQYKAEQAISSIPALKTVLSSVCRSPAGTTRSIIAASEEKQQATYFCIDIERRR
jgi:hypothetical protein